VGSVRVAIIGVGNCASALVQGSLLQERPDDGFIRVSQPRLAGYRGRHRVLAAFDVDVNKVGRGLSSDLGEAQQRAVRFGGAASQVPVQRGMTLDGLGHYPPRSSPRPGPTVDIAGILRETRTDVVVNFLPVGSEMATKWYVEQVLDAGCAFVNCIPVFIAREEYWRRRFEEHGLPIVGDDVKSQVGATIVHRVLTKLFMDRGVRMEHTSQLNVGGNTDFLNMLERARLASKKISKTDAVRSQLAHEMEADDIHIGPRYVPWLNDRKWAHIRLEGRSFGDQPINLELKLEVWDSPNSAGVVIDAIRSARSPWTAGSRARSSPPGVPDEVSTRAVVGRDRSRAAQAPSSKARLARPLRGIRFARTRMVTGASSGDMP
jgi:myo-inositol-1-phosphate synthase